MTADETALLVVEEALDESALQGRVDHLNNRREALMQRLLTASQQATQASTFQAFHGVAAEFLADVRGLYRAEQFPGADEAMGLLSNCIRIFQEERELTQRRVTALNNCRNSSRVLAETLTERLQLEGAGIPAPARAAPPQRPGRPGAVRDTAPAPGPEILPPQRPAFAGVPAERLTRPKGVQTIRLLEYWSARSAPRIARHLTYLMGFIPDALKQVDEPEREAVRDQWEAATTEQVANLRDAAEHWATTTPDALAEEVDMDNPDKERVDRLPD